MFLVVHRFQHHPHYPTHTNEENQDGQGAVEGVGIEGEFGHGSSELIRMRMGPRLHASLFLNELGRDVRQIPMCVNHHRQDDEEKDDNDGFEPLVVPVCFGVGHDGQLGEKRSKTLVIRRNRPICV